MREIRWVLLLLCLWALPSQALAGETGLRSKSDISFRLEPIALGTINDIGYRFSLYDGEDSVLRKNTYVEAGAALNLSPAGMLLGAYVEALPLALLQIRGTVQYLQYFGTFGFLYQPSDPNDPTWDLTDLQSVRDAGPRSRGRGCSRSFGSRRGSRSAGWCFWPRRASTTST